MVLGVLGGFGREFWGVRGGLGGQIGHVGGSFAPRLGFCKILGPAGPQSGAMLGPSWGHVGAKLALFRVILVIFVISKLNFNLKGV